MISQDKILRKIPRISIGVKPWRNRELHTNVRVGKTGMIWMIRIEEGADFYICGRDAAIITIRAGIPAIRDNENHLFLILGGTLNLARGLCYGQITKIDADLGRLLERG